MQSGYVVPAKTKQELEAINKKEIALLLRDLPKKMQEILAQYEYAKSSWYHRILGWRPDDHQAIIELKRFCIALSHQPSLIDLVKLTRLYERYSDEDDKLVDQAFNLLLEVLKAVYGKSPLTLDLLDNPFLLEHSLFNEEIHIQSLCSDTKAFNGNVKCLTILYEAGALNLEHYQMVLSMDEFKKPHGRFLPAAMLAHYQCGKIVIDREVIKVIYASLAQTSVYSPEKGSNSLRAAIPDIISTLHKSNMLTTEILCYVFTDSPYVYSAYNKITFLNGFNKNFTMKNNRFMLDLVKEIDFDLAKANINYLVQINCSVRLAQLLCLATMDDENIFSQLPPDIIAYIIMADPDFPTSNKIVDSCAFFRAKKTNTNVDEQIKIDTTLGMRLL